jgi:uncharacterized membrane protein/glutaredoxin
MSRTRPKPWLHRFARPLIGAIATAGVINTAYLTYLRFVPSSVCPTQTCAVLASRYATVFGQPLSLFGLLAYLAIALLALAPLLINPETQKSLRRDWEDKTWLLLFAAATGILVFSGYLMNVMFSEFVFGGLKLGLGGICPFCLFSAISATAIFILTLLGKEWDERGPLFSIGAIVSIMTLVGSLAVYAPQPVVAEGAITDGQGKPQFIVDTESGEAEIQLAKHLKNSGAVMYGAYWCPHCCEQKLLLGKQAMKEFSYVECAEGGKDAQTDVCRRELEESSKQTGQRAGFPTWKINGKYFSGIKKLPELAQASGYTGPQDFKNAMALCKKP